MAIKYLSGVTIDSTVLVVDAANDRVGIGTASPAQKLHVDGAIRLTSNPSVTGDGSSAQFWNEAGVGPTIAGANFQVRTNGNTTALHINSSQNVGIGTTSPAAKLSLGANDFMMVSVGSGGKAGILFHETGTATATDVQYGAKIFYDETLDVLQLSTRENNVDKLGIAIDRATGNVGIGTTAPGAKLDIVSTGTGSEGLRVDGASGGFAFVVKGGSDYTSHIRAGATIGVNYFTTPPSNGLIVEGNVGIGTTSPSYKLDVAGGDVRFVAAASTDALVRIIAANYATEYDARLFLGENDTNGMTIEYDGSNNVGFIGMNSSTDPTGAYSKRIRMSRDGSEVSFPVGNVGIGTTAPSSILHVDGTDPYVRINNVNSANNQGIKISYNYSDTHGFHLSYNANAAGAYIDNTYPITSGQPWGDIYFRQNSAGTMVTRMTIKADGGNVGIGTTAPKQKLIVEGVLATKPSGVDGYYSYLRSNWAENDAFELGISEDGASNFHKLITSSNYYFGSTLQFWTDDTEKMRITSAGNVGIGTTSPSTRLQVLSSQTNSSIRTGGLEMQSYDVNNSWYAENVYFDGNNWRLRSNGYATQMYMQTGTIDFNRVATGSAGDAATLLTTMRLVSNGNVLIGTTTDAGFKLDVNGITRLNGNVYTTGEQGIELTWSGSTLNDNRIGRIRPISTSSQNPYAGGLAFDYYKYDGAAYNWFEGMRLNGSGNVGIGTTNPSTTLDVLGKIKLGLDGTYGGSDYVTIGFGGTSNGYNRVFGYNGTSDGLYLTSATGRGISFRTNGGSTDNMFITAAGNVGIGTTAPDYKLTVAGQIASTLGSTNGYIALQAGHSTVQGYVEWYKPTPTRVAYMGYNDGVGANNLGLTLENSANFVINGGNVLIGTTSNPGYKLFVSGGSLGVNIGTASNNQAAAQFVDSARGLTYMPTVDGSAYNWASVTNGSALFNTHNSDWWVGNHDGSALRFVQNSSLVFYTNSGPRGAWTGTGLGIATNSPSTRIDAYGNPTATNGVIQATPTYVGGSYFTAFRAVPSDTGDQGNYTGLFMGSISSDNALITSGSVYNSAGQYLPGGTTSTGIGMSGGTFTVFGNTGLTAGTQFAPTARMQVIGSTGNVLIGTTTDAGYKVYVVGTGTSTNLGVVGNIRAGGTGTSGGEIIASGALGNGNYVSLRHDDTNGYITVTRTVYDGHLILQPYGNVGIGTTAPANNLHVYNASGSTIAIDGAGGNNTGLQYKNNGSLVAAITYVPATSQLHIFRGGDVMVIGNSNVGIGTTGPSYKLDVTGGSTTCRRGFSSPRFSSTGEYNYGVTNSPTWNVNQGAYTNNNATSPDGTTTAGTYSLTTVSWDLYQTIAVTAGVEYTVGAWVKLGTATNFCIVLNNTQAWNTVGGKAFDSSDGLSTGKWTHISFTFTAPASGNVNLHIGAHSESGVPQQTAGTVFLWNWEMSLLSSTWIGKVDDEIRLPGSSIWTSRGNVGIGTTSPNAKLNVRGTEGSGSVSPQEDLVHVGGNELGGVGGYAGIRIGGAGNTSYGAYIRGVKTSAYGGFWNTALTFSVTRTSTETTIDEAMRISSGANVLIGTTTDDGYKLRVNGTSYFDNLAWFRQNAGSGSAFRWGDLGTAVSTDTMLCMNQLWNGAGWTILNSNVGTTYLNLGSSGASPNIEFGTGPTNTAATTKMIILNNGNVGIGTTAPDSALEVNGRVSIRGANELYFGQSTSVIGSWTTRMYATGSAHKFNANTFIFNNEGYGTAEFVRITSTGNVGIGTTAPVTPLQVVSATNDVDVLRIGNTAGNSGSVQGFTHLAINHFDAGTFPSTRITAYQDGVSGWPGGMYFSTREVNTDSAPLERLRITSAGSIGINTTNPTSRLEVVGDARITAGSLGVGVAPNATDGRIDASNDIVAFSTSDRRLKENITPIANALEKVKSLTGVEFDWKEETKSVHGYEGHDVGVIAQDVQAVLPEAVRTNDSGYLSVRYEKMIALLVEANKELANRVEQLEKLIK